MSDDERAEPAPAPGAPGEQRGVAPAVSDGPDVPLPPLQIAVLDGATVAKLFEDLASEAEVVSIQVRGAGALRGEAGPPTLAEARALFEGSAIAGLQVRYRLGPTVWCDTLQRTPEGVRLVRIEPPQR